MKTTTRLENLLNREFIYKQENIRIKDYFHNTDDATFQIITDKKPFTIKEAEVPQFIEKLLPVDDENTKAVMVVVEQTEGLISTLQQTLLDNIKRIQTDEKYIKQANAINSSVNALIGMAKLQLQVTKMTPKK